MKEMLESIEKPLVNTRTRDRTYLLNNTDNTRDSGKIVSYPQEVCYKIEKRSGVIYKKSTLASKHYAKFLEKYMKRLLSD